MVGMQGLLRRDRKLFSLLYETRSLFPHKLGTLCCRRVISSSRLPIHHGKGTTYRLYGGKYQGVFHDPMACRPPKTAMGCRSYKTTSWLRKSTHGKSSSSCTVVTKSKKGKTIYRVQRSSKPERFIPEEFKGLDARVAKCRKTSDNLADAGRKASSLNPSDNLGQSLNMQFTRKTRPVVGDEAQKHVVDKLSLPQFTDTSVPNANTTRKGHVNVAKCRSVEVRKIRRESNNLLNSVCCKSHEKKGMKTNLKAKNVSLPELFDSRLYNFCSGDSKVKNPSYNIPGTFVELRPKKIRFSSKELLYPDSGKLGLERSGKVDRNKGQKLQADKSSNNIRDSLQKPESINEPLKTAKMKEEQANNSKMDDALDTPLKEISGLKLYIEGTDPRASSLGKVVKEMTKSGIPIENMFGRTSEPAFTSDSGSLKHEIELKNSACLFKTRNSNLSNSKLPDVLGKQHMKRNENVHNRNDTEIKSYRKSENLTIHKHPVKRAQKVSSVAYETHVLEKDGKTITTLTTKKGKRNSQSILHVKCPRDNITPVGNDKPKIVRREGSDLTLNATKTADCNFTVNPSHNTELPRDPCSTNSISRRELKQVERTHPPGIPGSTFDEIVNSMRLESENFLKRPGKVEDHYEPIERKHEAALSKSGIPDRGVSSNQTNAGKGSFSSNLEVRVKDQLVSGKNLEGELRPSKKVSMPLTQSSSFQIVGGKSVSNSGANAKPNTPQATRIFENSAKNAHFRNEPVDIISQKQGHNKFSESPAVSPVESKSIPIFPANAGMGGYGTNQQKTEVSATERFACMNDIHRAIINDGACKMVQKSAVTSKVESAAQVQSSNPSHRPHQPLVDPLSSRPPQKPSFSAKVKENSLTSMTNAIRGFEQIKFNPPQHTVGNSAPERRKVTKKVYNSHNTTVHNYDRAEYNSGSFVQPLSGPLKSVTKNQEMKGKEGACLVEHTGAGEVVPNVHPETSEGRNQSKIQNSMFSAIFGHRSSQPNGPSIFGKSADDIALIEGTRRANGSSGDAGQHCLKAKSISQFSGSSAGTCKEETPSCIPTCKPGFPPVISNSGVEAGCGGNCVPTSKPVFPPSLSTSHNSGVSASDGNVGTKPVFPPLCCSPPLCEEPKYERPSVNFGPPLCCSPPPLPECPSAPPMKSQTYSILDVSSMSKPPVPICIDCKPKEKPCFPPKPPSDQSSSASPCLQSTSTPTQMKFPCSPATSPPCCSPGQDISMHCNYSSIGWFEVTKTYLLDKAFSLKCLLAEIIANFLALVKARAYFLKLQKSEACSTCNVVQSSIVASNQPLVSTASKYLRPPSEKSKSRKEPHFKRKIRFIKTVKRSVHDDQSRQAILLEEQRRKAIGSKANPALAYSEVLNIVFNQKNEFASVAKKQKRRSAVN